MKVTIHDLKEMVMEALQDRLEIRSVQTFTEAGVMTKDTGLVVTDLDGNVVQITFTLSR